MPPPPQFTPLQRQIASLLLEGCSVSGSTRYGYRVHDAGMNPVARINARTFYKVASLCRKQNGRMVIDKRIVRSLHGRAWIKKQYKKSLIQKTES
jgi:hypothetical protein